MRSLISCVGARFQIPFGTSNPSLATYNSLYSVGTLNRCLKGGNGRCCK